MRAALAARNAGNAKISVMTPEQAAAQPAGSYDMIVLHSVAQYLGGEPSSTNCWRPSAGLLKPTGTFVLGDIIKPQLAAPMAALALLRFGAANGFFWAAVGGLIRIFVSDYLKIKGKVGLSHYEEARHAEEAARRRLRAGARAAQHRPQPAAHDLPGPAVNRALTARAAGPYSTRLFNFSSSLRAL